MSSYPKSCKYQDSSHITQSSQTGLHSVQSEHIGEFNLIFMESEIHSITEFTKLDLLIFEKGMFSLIQM